jgi:glycosyltransferase involved in cell wall biosynthesis
MLHSPVEHQVAGHVPSAGQRILRVLEIGGGWFAEQGGGLNRYFSELLQVLPSIGIAPRGLVAGSSEVPRISNGMARSFAPLDAPIATRLLRQRQAVRAELASSATDLIASHFALYAFPALREIGRKPFVVHFHGPWAAESRAENGGRLGCWAKSRLERAVYHRAHRVVVLSQAFARIVEQDYGVVSDRIRIVPGGVDSSRFDIAMTRVDCRHQLRWPTDRPILLCVRRLVHRRGIENLIEAVVMVRRQVPDVLVLIAGSGALKELLQKKIHDEGLGENVRLLGFVPDADLPLAYRAADLSIVPSISLEGFGLTAAESLAAGTPVLVAPVGGLPEVVKPLSENLLLTCVEPAAIADAITNALSGRTPMPSQRDCRSFAASRFDWKPVIRQIRDVYEEVLT